jgi:hypothetical protein
LAKRSGKPKDLKMLIGREGAHGFCVSIFGRIEHLHAEVQTEAETRRSHQLNFGYPRALWTFA